MKPKMKTREICQYIPCGQTEACDSDCYVKRLEAETAALREKLERAEFYEKCIGERYAEYHKINIGQEQEIFKLERQLAAAEKERDAVIEDFESAAHTGNDFCEFCGADCVDAGNDYIKDTCQCGMFVYRGGQGEKGEEGCMK